MSPMYMEERLIRKCLERLFYTLLLPIEEAATRGIASKGWDYL